jgi:hypothetical protein
MASKTWSERRKEKTARLTKGRKTETEKVIPALYAFIAVAGNGQDEGVVACLVPGVGVTPLVCSSPKELPMMRHQAQRACDGTGHQIRLVKFTRIEVLDVLEPDPNTTLVGRAVELGGFPFPEPEEADDVSEG